ncbi:hypothetical protein [Nitrosomonas marina]|uniref:Uncharacterized protein n=1 Tax=Nitrosomonas marina TaxID=917 RepID=A0A1H8GAD1_9PROT|nr:hypothetical protein [Nitrosomonas marina]SEN40714.1 hypothetical protein SAMN05216325_1176 [Nitrosomonas marina]
MFYRKLVPLLFVFFHAQGSAWAIAVCDYTTLSCYAEKDGNRIEWNSTDQLTSWQLDPTFSGKPKINQLGLHQFYIANGDNRGFSEPDATNFATPVPVTDTGPPVLTAVDNTINIKYYINIDPQNPISPDWWFYGFSIGDSLDFTVSIDYTVGTNSLSSAINLISDSNTLSDDFLIYEYFDFNVNNTVGSDTASSDSLSGFLESFTFSGDSLIPPLTQVSVDNAPGDAGTDWFFSNTKTDIETALNDINALRNLVELKNTETAINAIDVALIQERYLASGLGLHSYGATWSAQQEEKQVIDAIWDSSTITSGNWVDGDNWLTSHNTDEYPDNNGNIYNVFIDNDGSAGAVVRLNEAVAVNSLSLSKSDQLVVDGQSALLSITNNYVQNGLDATGLTALALQNGATMIVNGDLLHEGKGAGSGNDNVINIDATSKIDIQGDTQVKEGAVISVNGEMNTKNVTIEGGLINVGAVGKLSSQVTAGQMFISEKGALQGIGVVEDYSVTLFDGGAIRPGSAFTAGELDIEGAVRFFDGGGLVIDMDSPLSISSLTVDAINGEGGWARFREGSFIEFDFDFLPKQFEVYEFLTALNIFPSDTPENTNLCGLFFSCLTPGVLGEFDVMLNRNSDLPDTLEISINSNFIVSEPNLLYLILLGILVLWFVNSLSSIRRFH